MSAPYDRRIVAARPDLAAAHLKGIVVAERYREGRIKQVVKASVGLRSAPGLDAPLETELLFGEMAREALLASQRVVPGKLEAAGFAFRFGPLDSASDGSPMYTAFYGLREKPFALSPDPRFLYLAASHREALAHLLYGIEQGEGFIAITGEVGTGKTTLCRTLLQRAGGLQLPPDLRAPLLGGDHGFHQCRHVAHRAAPCAGGRQGDPQRAA